MGLNTIPGKGFLDLLDGNLEASAEWPTVVDPIARGRDPLTGGNGCGVPNVPMAAHFGTQNAETILGVVVSYSLDEARQHLAVGWFGLYLHEPRYSVRACHISKYCTGGFTSKPLAASIASEQIPCSKRAGNFCNGCSEPLGLNRDLCRGFTSLMGVLILELDGTHDSRERIVELFQAAHVARPPQPRPGPPPSAGRWRGDARRRNPAPPAPQWRPRPTLWCRDETSSRTRPAPAVRAAGCRCPASRETARTSRM